MRSSKTSPSPLVLMLCTCLVTLCPQWQLFADEPSIEREILVPVDALDVLLEAGPRRVLLKREEYLTLLQRAKKTAEERAPQDAIILSANYQARIEGEHVVFEGSLSLEVLQDGLHAVALNLEKVGLRSATLDGDPAPIGSAVGEDLTLFVKGRGLHHLQLVVLAPLDVAAATQSLHVTLPAPPASTLQLSVPGDVEVREGAMVVKREVDATEGFTRFELLPQGGPLAFTLSLNNRLHQTESAMVARSLFVNEVTTGYERLHATISLELLHGELTQTRFLIPQGFEVTKVTSPSLAQWAVTEAAEGRVLEVQLQDDTGPEIVLSVVATKQGAELDAWTFSRFIVLDVLAQEAVYGILAEHSLETQSLTSQGLVPIDIAAIRDALPASVFQVDTGAPPLQSVAAYYAPHREAELNAKFSISTARFRSTTSLLLTADSAGLTLSGGFALWPEVENLASFNIQAPSDWPIHSITLEDKTPVPFHRRSQNDGVATWHVQLPETIPAGTRQNLHVEAKHQPDGWLDEWTTFEIQYPPFSIEGSYRDSGALSVSALEDYGVRPAVLDQLSSLDADELQTYGLAHDSIDLAYRFDRRPFAANLIFERVQPRLTARALSFFRVETDSLTAHYELIYEAQDARTRTLSFDLPLDTSRAISIRGIDSQLKDFSSTDLEDARRWTVRLAQPRQGNISLAVDLQKEFESATQQEIALPMIRAAEVEYQSGAIAIEGTSDYDIQVTKHPRPIDVAELSAAEYQPGMRLLGSFGYLGRPEPVTVKVTRSPGYAVPATIVQRAELLTRITGQGASQTVARYLLRTKARFVEIVLPTDASLLSVRLDGEPQLMQRDKTRLVVSLPADQDIELRDLQLTYEAPIEAIELVGNIELKAPQLFLRESADGESLKVPAAAVQWDLYLAPDLEWDHTAGTVFIEGSTNSPSTTPTWLSSLTGWLLTDRNVFSPIRSGISSPATLEARPGTEPNSVMIEDSVTAFPSDLAGAELDPFADPEQEASDPRDRDQGPLVIVGQQAPTLEDGFLGGVPGIPDKQWALAGNRSLLIDLTEEVGADRQGDLTHLSFHSLGDDPRLELRLVDRRRLESLTWGLALLALLVGILLTRRPTKTKVTYVGALLVGSIVLPPLLGDSRIAESVCQAAFLSGFVLIAYYIAYAIAMWRPGQAQPSAPHGQRIQGAAFTMVIALTVSGLTMSAQAQQVPPLAFTKWIESLPKPPRAVNIPDDAILVPYDGEQPNGIEQANDVFVPYDKYIELWKLAYDASPVDQTPAPFALADGRYETTLSMDQQLTVRGTFKLHVFANGAVDIPLVLEGGVLSSVTIDGTSAQLRSVQPNIEIAASKPTPEMAGQVEALSPITVLRTSGPGIKQLALEVRLQLQRHGGWRMVKGTLPFAASTALDLKIDSDHTEVRLLGAPDQEVFDETSAGNVIESALSNSGSFHWQWRPKVSSGDIDRSLAAESEAVFHIREDGLHLDWHVDMEFRGTSRREFEFLLPGEYFVEKIDGLNVRGWDVRKDDQGDIAIVTLLSEAKQQETITLRLSRRMMISTSEENEIRVPVVAPRDAALHHGRITVRRSPRLNVRPERVVGASRTDLVNVDSLFPQMLRTSALGIEDFQAFQFSSGSPEIAITVTPKVPDVSTQTRMVLRLSERSTDIEARIHVAVRDLPIYQMEIGIPLGLELEQLIAPGASSYAVTQEDARQRINLLLPEGQASGFDIILRGSLANPEDSDARQLPWIDVPNVRSQSGRIAVLADPAFDVEIDQLENASERLIDGVEAWLSDEQRSAARLAISYGNQPAKGNLKLTVREPIVSTQVICNARVTDRAIEETIVIECEIQRAGIREIVFLLPEYLSKARIRVPRLRQKTITPAEDREGWVRVNLELEDEVQGQLRVLIERDRLLTSDSHEIGSVIVETGHTTRHYVTMESMGRDEVVVESHTGLESLDHQHSAWKELSAVLGKGLTQVFLATEQTLPSLTFRTRQRTAVQTVGAQIGLADATLTIDTNGSYRGTQVYRVQNTTEQYLIVELPANALLWTAHVAGEPVKPTLGNGAADSRVRIPLVKTSAGDRDYEVRLVYGGRMSRLGNFRQVDFPLLSVENIGVQRSQVRLHVPQTHRWFDFGGSMGLVEDQGYEERALLDYGSAQLESLLGLMDSVSSKASYSSYEGKRARQALESLVEEQMELQLQLQSEAGKGVLTEELHQNAQLLEKAQRELQRTDTAEENIQPLDNRKRLNVWYFDQSNSRSRNAVDKLGASFSPSEKESEYRKDQPLAIQNEFLERFRMERKSTSLGRKGSLHERAPAQGGGAYAAPRQDVDSDGALAIEQEMERVFGVPSIAIQENTGESSPQDLAVPPMQTPQVEGRGGAEERMGQAASSSVTEDLPQTANPEGQFGESVAQLASLPEVALDERGQVYLFSTARGDTKITARAVSDGLVTRVVKIAIVLGCLLALVITYRWTRGPVSALAKRLDNWYGVMALSALGIVSVCGGILPILGFLSLVAVAIVCVRTVIGDTLRRAPVHATREDAVATP